MMTDLDIIKECRQTGRTRTTTKNLLEKAYYEQMTDEIDISRVLIEGDTATIMGEKYKRVEEPKTPAEEAFKRVYGAYPPTTPSVSNFEDTRWIAFQKGYNASQKPEKEQQMKELIRESVRWCEEHQNESVEDYLTPQGPQGPVGPGPGPKGVIVGYEPTPKTPEQVADGLKEAFREAVKQGVVSSSNKPQTLYDLIADWWDEIFMNNNEAAVTIESLVDDIEEWLPKEQTANSQNAYVECSVEGFNDCINKIRRKLR